MAGGSSFFGGGSSSGKSGSSFFGGSSKAKKSSGGGGLFGTGIGPDAGPDLIPDSAIEHAWNAATFAPKSLVGLTTGAGSFLGHGLSAIAWKARGAVGETPQAQANALAHRDLAAAGQFPVGAVQGFGQGISNLADIPAIIPGVQGYGEQVNRATGVGLAEIGAAASDKPVSGQQVAGAAHKLAPPSFQQAANQPGGILNPALNTVGALATIGGAAVKGGDFAQGVAGDAHPVAASAAEHVSQAGEVLRKPLKGTFSSTVGQLGQAARLQRDAHSLNLNPEARAYYDAAGKDLGMRPPNKVVNDNAVNGVESGAPMAAEYQNHPVNPEDLSPKDTAAAAKAYGTAPGAKTGLIPETEAQFTHLTKPTSEGGMGVQVEYVDRASNPYAKADGSTDFDAMLKDIRENKHLYVDKTSPDEGHPYMTPDQNDRFRAVHDAFGHSVAGNDFGPNGEEVAFQHHSQMYSPDAQRALAMETRAQNSALNYSPDNLARAAAGEGKQFDVQRAGVMPEDMSRPGYTRQPSATELASPTARAEQARAEAGPAPWAERAVGHLKPEGAVSKVLSGIERTHGNHALSVINREQARGVEADMNVADKQEPFIKAMQGAVDALRAEHPEIKPAAASTMLGDELRSRLTAGGVPDLVRRARENGASQRVIDRLEQAGHQKKSMLPREMLTPAVDKAVETLRGEYGNYQAKVREGYAASETLGDRGLSDLGPKDEAGQPKWTKQQRVLQQRIDKLESVAAKARTKEQTRELTSLTKQRDALVTAQGRVAETIKGYTDTRNLAAEKLAETRGHVEPPVEGSPGKTAAQQVRATPAAPNPELPAREASLANHEDNAAAIAEARDVRGIGYTKDQQLEAEQDAAKQGIVADKNVLKNASKQETPNSALRRGVDLAYGARDIADATERIAAKQRQSDALQKQIDSLNDRIEGRADTAAEKKAQRADMLRIKTQMRLTKSLEEAPPSQWLREYRPAGLELERLQEEAKTDPELRQWVEGAEPTFRAFMSRIAAEGVDPQYVRDFTPTQVGKLLRDQVDLNPSRIEIAGARKQWSGTLQRAQNGSLDTSLESFVAAMHEMHREIARNIGVDYFEKNYALPVAAGTEIDPNQWSTWDPARSYMQQGREGTNLVVSKGTRYVIPKSLDLAIRAAEQDYTTKLGSFLGKFTNPWRTAIITASPAFYLQHVVSHAVLATVEGVGLKDWANAWQEYRNRGNGNVYDMLQGHSIAREVGSPATMTPAQGMRERMIQELRTAKADGRGLIGTSRAGASGAVHGLAATLHNFTNVTDALSRTAVYLHDVGKPGFNESDALNRAYAAVVDYGDLSHVERTLVRQVVPFYSFQKQILKIAMKMPVDHPIVMALAAQFNRINEEQQKDAWGQGLTDGYAGIIPFGKTGVDTRKINPFKDASGLITPDGIASSLHPLLGEALRYFFHSPSGGYVAGRTVDPYGNAVPQLTEAQIGRDVIGGIPGVQEATALAGGGTHSPLAQTGTFLGANVRSGAEMQKIADRIAGSRAAAAANSPFATKKKKTGFFGAG